MIQRRPSLSVIIPAFNEEARIERTLEAAGSYLRAAPWSAEVLVVDDGSRDGTADLVRKMIAEFPVPLRLLEEPHRGKGGAVRAGMLASEADWRFLSDADLAMPFEAIALFLEAAGPSEIVIGSRVLSGASRSGDSLVRHALGRGFGALTRIAGIRGIADTQCGYKLFSGKAAREIFSRSTTNGFAFDVEALMIAQRRGYQILEIAVPWTAQAESKVRPLRDSIGMLGEVLSIRYRDLKREYTR